MPERGASGKCGIKHVMLFWYSLEVIMLLLVYGISLVLGFPGDGTKCHLLGTARSSRAHSAGLRPALRVRGFRDVSRPDSSHAIFACGVGDHFRLLSVAERHGKVAASRRGSWGRPESPSTEDVCLRCWLNSDSPDGDGGARHGGCCHRTLVRARARDETLRRTADSFGA